jgi:[acyl-carrier-protein] S-malonyltransferase
MKIGFLFPGQGSQSIGMGKDLFEKYEEVKNIYKEIKELTDIDVEKIMLESEEDVLTQTKYTQICILAMSLAILKLLDDNGIQAEVASGLSLGEYTALIYANAITFKDGVKLVKKRGEYMQELVPDGEWLMAAILGMNEEQIYEVCSKVKKGFVVPANFNTEGQIVISGEKEGVEEAVEIAKEMGAKKARTLKTSGPFHTEKLIEASKALGKELENVKINNPKIKVIKNIDGSAYSEGDNIKEILAKHIITSVKFSKTLKTMLDEGVDTFIEIGPGKTLSGFVKRINTEKEINILNINNVETLEKTIEFIKGGKINE